MQTKWRFTSARSTDEWRHTYSKVWNEREQASADASPVEILAVEIMVADDGEYVHDDEQQQDRRRHPLCDRLEESHHENLQAAHVVQDAKDADDP